MHKYFNLLVVLFFINACQPIEQKENKELKKPKLVVGIVIDQLRHDYFERYAENFGEEGFKRLISEGFYGTVSNIFLINRLHFCGLCGLLLSGGHHSLSNKLSCNSRTFF